MNKINPLSVNISSYIVCFYPFAIAIGPAAANTFILLSTLSFVLLNTRSLVTIFDNTFFKLFLLFWTILILSSIFSEEKLYSLKTSLLFIRYGIFVIVCKSVIENNKSFLDNFFKINFFLISFVALDGIFQFFYGANFFGFTMYNLQDNRISGIFQSELILGSFLSKITLIVCGIGIFKNKIKLTFTLLLIAFIGILISGERASLAIFSISIFFILFFARDIKKFFLIFTIMIIGIGTLSMLKSNNLKARLITETYNSFFNLNKTNNKKIYIFSEGHQIIYNSSIKMFKDNPVLGIGPNNYRKKCNLKKYFIEDDNYILFKSRNNDGLVNHCNTHPHNFYIQLLAETGLIGFIFIFGLFTYLLYLLIIKKKIFSDSEICILIGFFITLWPLTTNGNFFNNWINLISFYPLGFLLYILSIKNKER